MVNGALRFLPYLLYITGRLVNSFTFLNQIIHSAVHLVLQLCQCLHISRPDLPSISGILPVLYLLIYVDMYWSYCHNNHLPFGIQKERGQCLALDNPYQILFMTGAIWNVLSFQIGNKLRVCTSHQAVCSSLMAVPIIISFYQLAVPIKGIQHTVNLGDIHRDGIVIKLEGPDSIF
nr:MAG TPA: hypothetical protein [Caudoviricetes sp.]